MRAEGKSGQFGDLFGGALGKLGMRVQPGADRCSTDGEIVEPFEHLLQSVDVAFAQASGDAMSAMLRAFPHLFPPGSNRWQPDDPDPVRQTLASPGIWTGFADFYRQAADAAKIAHAMGRAGTAEDVKSRARELRIVCDSCHALYLEEP